jgi:Flp pilus assembly protein TadB
LSGRRISAAARARRALLADVVAAAVLAGIALTLSAGLGVVAVLALPVIVIGIASLLVEHLLGRLRRRRSRLGPRAKAVNRALE